MDDWIFADERDPDFVAYLLRPDSSLQGEKANLRFPFDEDADAYICQIQGGYDTRVDSFDVQEAFTTGSLDGKDEVLMAVLGELMPAFFKDLIKQSGATPREIAAYVRSRPNTEITLPMSIVLNWYSDHGQLPLPYVIDKLCVHEYDEVWF
ncbi:MAG: hypothetical protein OXE81_01885 [Gammaproteobacteria bacterium]|nr:hypothetical protein [Gammaproteobacteria bacterium]MCY4276573.1 hypothetical protein [Gammaproteobacteria bacterium]